MSPEAMASQMKSYAEMEAQFGDADKDHRTPEE
jgi:hypothetical protein